MSVTLKVMSFNMRIAAKVDGLNFFWNRAEKVKKMLFEEKPDLIGFQEVTDEMRDWLKKEFPEYTVLGCGREKDYRGESVPLAFRTDAFELVELSQFWLSPTPHIAGSRYTNAEQSKCPRITVAATLKHREASELLRFYNTHLDCTGHMARMLGAAQVMQSVSAWGGKCVITGDFNAGPEGVLMKSFTDSPEYPLVDATASLPGTYHGYGKIEPYKIDYILTNAACDSNKSYLISDEPTDGIYLSDHNPVCAYITLE